MSKRDQTNVKISLYLLVSRLCLPDVFLCLQRHSPQRLGRVKDESRRRKWVRYAKRGTGVCMDRKASRRSNDFMLTFADSSESHALFQVYITRVPHVTTPKSCLAVTLRVVRLAATSIITDYSDLPFGSTALFDTQMTRMIAFSLPLPF